MKIHFGILGTLIFTLAGCSLPHPASPEFGADVRNGQTPGRVELPGPQADGSVLLHNQWSLRPAGRQVEVGDFPANVAVVFNRGCEVLHSFV